MVTRGNRDQVEWRERERKDEKRVQKERNEALSLLPEDV